jgi:hypothetical protein
MFTLLKPVLTTLAVLTMLTVAQAADYESMSTQELSQLRGTMYNKSDEERDAFRSVWQQRINQMSEEEKANYLGSGSGRGQGNRSGTGLGDGTGRGRGNGQQGQGQQGQGQQGQGQQNGGGPQAGGSGGKGRS